MDWKTLSSKYLSKHIYFTAREDRCEMPDGTIVDPYFVVELPTSVCALALTERNEAILLQQYRHPLKETIIEIPGGFVDKGESSDTGIARELLEETGYEFRDIYFVARVAANPGVLDNYTDLYLATGGKKVASQKLDHSEEIELKLVPLDEVREMLMRNEFKQAMHAACLFYAFNKLDSFK
jgi:ADP-ribose pyrophosphatase